ncbi:MAG: asparagine synthase-related protein [Nitrospiraceae bacterium]|nr:asparagine synthase-related protein [Nitrospiraceae bacterium]
MPQDKDSCPYPIPANMRSAIGNNALMLRRDARSFFWQDDRYKVYWEGLVFVSGILSGAESVKAFIAGLEKTAIEDACGILKGIYFFIIESKKGGDIHAFIDNSGLYQAFYTSGKISNSFLELAAHEGHTAADFEPDAVVEFLNFGSLLSGETYLSSIRRIRHDEILRLPRPGAKLLFIKKKNAGLRTSPDIHPKSFEQHFHELAASLGNCRVSIDLTGGADTRLVAAMLDHCGLQFEAASSGGTSEYADISMPREIARAMGHPWFGTIHSASALQDDINDLLAATDGLYDILYYHRLYQLQKARKKRGIDTMISGVGGELFKDYWWLHEFPFYRRKTSDVKKLVNMRIMPSRPLLGIFSKRYAGPGGNLKDNLVRSFSRYVMDTNTKTLDNIFYNAIMRNMAGRILTSHTRYVKCLAPFLDPDLATMGFNLPRMQRFYNFFHRRELTKINRRLARFKTSENGMTLSYRPADILLDLPRYIGEKGKRVLIKLRLAQRGGPSSLNDPACYPQVRNMKLMLESLDALKDARIINKDVRLHQLADSRLGSFLTLGMVAAALERGARGGQMRIDRP